MIQKEKSFINYRVAGVHSLLWHFVLARKKTGLYLFFLPMNFDKLVKSHFANDIEQFWIKIQNEPGVYPPQAG